ncbi:centrosome-associated protein 350 [Ictalurus punctatus]|uniref:Centrosome-associated protein 350 n=1 Tax=Ictalurus punctatus TaxID=7998 RepID=A0A979EAP0_ICTPU|nr:centrosome-associated protein 350 [Ictalurus punctatus]
MYSQGQFQCHLSLAQSQQYIWEEEIRARQFSALFRLREKALWERTQAELAWLEHCKKNALSKEDSVTEIKRKQEEVVSRLRHEEAEIHHWRNVCKSGRQQRRLLLYHHRDILDIKKSTTHLRQVLENQAMTETDARPRETASALEGKSLITKPGIIPAARGEDKLPSKQGRQVSPFASTVMH